MPLIYHHITVLDTNMWLGGHDQTAEGSWVWQESNEAFIYSIWAADEPMTADCLQTDVNHAMMWKAVDCAAVNKGLCQVDLASAGTIIE